MPSAVGLLVVPVTTPPSEPRRWVEPGIFEAVCEELAAQKRKVKRLEAKVRRLERELAAR